MVKFVQLKVRGDSQPVAVNPEHVARVAGVIHHEKTVASIMLVNGERVETVTPFDEALRLLQGGDPEGREP